MKISDIIHILESIAPPSYQESYDNVGLLTGHSDWDCTGIICTLDATEEVIDEAINNKFNCIVAHHPIIFKGLKKINGNNYVERAVIKAIKNDIAIYAIHTNLDNIIAGVNARIADKLGLINREILSAKSSFLNKIYTFVPLEHLDTVRNAIFAAGAGGIGNYSECSFTVKGIGTFKAGEGTDPYAGRIGERHHEEECKIEIVFPSFLQQKIISALIKAHPYEEVAYDVIELMNEPPGVGSGILGELPDPTGPIEFLRLLKTHFQTPVVRHTALTSRNISKVALCGGAGSFLVSKALRKGADVFVTADMKYHEFFDAEGRMVICDIGHFESEQFTTDLLYDILVEKFPTFAVLKSKVKTNPVHYFTG